MIALGAIVQKISNPHQGGKVFGRRSTNGQVISYVVKWFGGEYCTVRPDEIKERPNV